MAYTEACASGRDRLVSEPYKRFAVQKRHSEDPYKNVCLSPV